MKKSQMVIAIESLLKKDLGITYFTTAEIAKECRELHKANPKFCNADYPFFDSRYVSARLRNESQHRKNPKIHRERINGLFYHSLI